MEEEMSMISNARTNVSGEHSNSISSNYPTNTKRPRLDNNVSSSRFKGVVGQQNGHWGAQIYANHQRIWLGTFKSEKEAAMAYDSAAIKLRSGDSDRNFPWTNITNQEPNFQSLFNTEAVLNMIKDGSYPSKFADYLSVPYQKGEIEAGCNLAPVHGNGGWSCRHLFHKELTPSDVGKLNRLVIPKKCALKYFPNISDGAEEIEASGGVDNIQLVFFDQMMRSWKFRYCYWKSSQSFVFTRGWNRFVKENELKAKDMVIFYLCECKARSEKVRTFFLIHVEYYDGVESNGGVVEDINEDDESLPLDLGQDIVNGEIEDEFEGVLPHDVGKNFNDGDDEKESEEEKKLDLELNVDNVEDVKESEEEKELVRVESTDAKKEGLRLFGVQII